MTSKRLSANSWARNSSSSSEGLSAQCRLSRMMTRGCPLDAVFWRDKIGKTYREIAKWAADKPNVPGIVMDAEMYGADRTAIGDACFCEPCKSEIASDMGVSAGDLDLSDDAIVDQYREHSYLGQDLV